MSEVKFYEVIRKHPNNKATFDMSVGANLYKKGELVRESIFIGVYGSEKSAKIAINDFIEAGWIRLHEDKKKKETKEVN